MGASSLWLGRPVTSCALGAGVQHFCRRMQIASGATAMPCSQCRDLTPEEIREEPSWQWRCCQRQVPWISLFGIMLSCQNVALAS